MPLDARGASQDEWNDDRRGSPVPDPFVVPFSSIVGVPVAGVGKLPLGTVNRYLEQVDRLH